MWLVSDDEAARVDDWWKSRRRRRERWMTVGGDMIVGGVVEVSTWCSI